MKNKLIVNCEQLYNNCIYSSVAHAIFVLKAPLFNYTQSWDGINYNFNYGTTRGIITFDLSGQTVTGAARDDTSIRRKWYPVYKAISLFDQAPEKNRLLAHNETLEYLYDEEGGMTKPMATIAFWNEGNEIYTNDDDMSFITNGGEYILEIAKNHKELKDYLVEEYDLSSEELYAIDHIFNCLISNKKIKKDDLPIINKRCNGYDECLESLNELGIHIE